MTRLVDLTQPTSRESQPHPSFPAPLILPFRTHADGTSSQSNRTSKSEMIVLHNHAATHVDSISHFSADPDAEDIDEMSLDTFYGAAVCVDFRRIPARHYITVAEFEEALDRGGLEILEDDVVLFCTDHYGRTAGSSDYLTEFSGVSAELVHWLADREIKAFGVESISPDLPMVTKDYPSHQACDERRLTHYENLCNLAEVVNRRFMFYGFPLRLVGAAGSPVRAVAILND